MKTRFIVLAVALTISACATLRAKDPFRNPDGTFNLPKILAYAEDGIQADCQVGTGHIAVAVCQFGLPGVQAAEAFVANDPKMGAPAVAQLLIALEMKVPQISPYVDWAVAILKGQA